MKRLFFVFAMLVMANASHASEEWREAALPEVQGLSDVVEAMWSDTGALWLSTFRTDDKLPFYTEIAVCSQLIFAGKPQGEIVIVRWFDAAKMNQRLVTVARANCR